MIYTKILTLSITTIMGFSIGYVQYGNTTRNEEIKILEERSEELKEESKLLEKKIEEMETGTGYYLNSYKEIGNSYKKDEKNIYYMGHLVRGADIETFEVVNKTPDGPTSHNYAKDKNNFYIGDLPIKDIDIKSFEIINDYYFKDKNGIYGERKKIDSKKAYVQGYVELTKLEDIDPETFEIIKLYYSKDKNSIYFSNGKKLEGVDFETFEIFEDGGWEAYAKDKNYIYFEGEKHPELDVETFELLYTCGAYSQCYARDKNYVYDMYDLSIFEGLDGATFEVLNDSHQKDKNHVYLWNKIIEGADPETFEPITMCSHVMNAHYGKDNNYGYYNGEKIENSNGKTFKVLGIRPCEYSSDENNLYYRGKILENADSESFEYIGENRKEKENCENKKDCDEYYDYAKDKNNCYKNSEKVDMSECNDFSKN